jgi:hypothetical protein
MAVILRNPNTHGAAATRVYVSHYNVAFLGGKSAGAWNCSLPLPDNDVLHIHSLTGFHDVRKYTHTSYLIIVTYRFTTPQIY